VVEVNDVPPFRGGRTLGVSLVLAVLGFGVLGYGWSSARTQALFAYLVAFAFVAALALGALIFLMIGYVVGATWSVVLRRLNEAVVAVFPALALLFVPIAAGLPHLYSWIDPARAFSGQQLLLLRHKAAYLNATGFLVRSGFYLLLWTLAASWLGRASRARDARAVTTAESLDPDDVHASERRFSAAFLPLVALSLTFASFDWLMSLQPLWHSTLFGVYYFAGGFVSSFGLLAMLAYLAQRSSVGRALIRPAHFHALGRLMLGFTIFWGYCAFFQALLIQIADKPQEVTFYTARLLPGWRGLSWSLAVVRLALPFVLLLPRACKFHPGAMALLGSLLIAGEYLDVLWLVSPVQGPARPVLDIWDVAALFAVGGSAVAFAAWRQQGRPWVPQGDPKLELSVAYRSPL
jgi:hypothetical protein